MLRSEGLRGAQEADRGTGVSPRGSAAGTMNTHRHPASRPGCVVCTGTEMLRACADVTTVSGRAADRAGVGREMKFRVAREVLADAVDWTARSLPPRPSVPVLAGCRLEVEGTQPPVSGFDYEGPARAEVDVHATGGGGALVPGRLLAEITR